MPTNPILPVRPSTPLRLVAALVAAAAASSPGCASSHGFAAGLEAPRGAGWLAGVTDDDIRGALAAHDLRLDPPVRVVLVDTARSREVTWGDAGDALIDASFQRLIDADLVKDVVVAASEVTPSPREATVESPEYLKPARLAAARRSGDVAVSLQVSARDDRWMNPLGVLYVSIVGLWLAPGHHHDVAARADAIAVDVRDGRVVAAASGEGRVSRVRPFALLDVDADRADAERAAVQALLPELAGELRSALRMARTRS